MRLINFLSICFAIYLLLSPCICISQSCSQNESHPGYNTVTQLVGSVTIERDYILHLPSNYDSDTPTPLMINMHGFGDCAANFADDVGKSLNELADEENFIVAYPQGAYRPEKEDHYWEPGDNGIQDIFENDTYFIEQLILDISNNYNVNSDKVFAAGYSNGGMMAYSLACNLNDRVSGIGVMSGALLDDECNNSVPVPIIIFHGIADGVLPYDGGQWYRPVSEVVNFWLDNNNIDASSLVSEELNGGNVRLDHYFDNNADACVQLYTVFEEWDKPGDHVWFSDQIEGVTPNKILWDFFDGSCSDLISTNDISRSDLNINPNPFSSSITIAGENIKGEVYSIYNIQGKLIERGLVETSAYRIELSSMLPNIYFLKIGDTTKKIVKTE